MKELKFSDILESDIYMRYYYSSEPGIFSMRNSKFKEKHLIKENLIILSINEMSKDNMLTRFQLGWSLDFDALMLNQIAMTFKRQDGFLQRNDTGDKWYWNAKHYGHFQSNSKFDYDDNVIWWFVSMVLKKIFLVLGIVISFALLSVTNGLLIRVAIMSSSVIIFPLLSCSNSILRHQISAEQVGMVYRTMPQIGAQAAHLDRRGLSKFGLIGSFLWCLMIFYFMYGSCYFMWTCMIFPSAFSPGINDIYFFYINMIEFLSFFFVRTRCTIKYLPKIITMINVSFIFYVNSYFFAASYEALSFMSLLTFFVIMIFIKYIE